MPRSATVAVVLAALAASAAGASTDSFNRARCRLYVANVQRAAASLEDAWGQVDKDCPNQVTIEACKIDTARHRPCRERTALETTECGRCDYAFNELHCAFSALSYELFWLQQSCGFSLEWSTGPSQTPPTR